MTVALVLVALFALFSLPPLRRLPPLSSRRDRAALAAGVFFVFTGAMHFAAPEMYDRMIPPFLPGPARAWTDLSGALEILGGLGLFPRRTRAPAAAGLVLLLFAILPANVHVAVSGVEVEALPYPRWYFWLRLPFQLFYVAWVAWAGGLREHLRRGRAAFALRRLRHPTT